MNIINIKSLKLLYLILFSFGITKPYTYAQESNLKVNISTALRTITYKWEYQLGEFANEKYISKNKLTENCNDERCITFCILNNYLIASYRVKDVVECGTQIISLSSFKNIIQDFKTVFYVQKADVENKILHISLEGYDKKGRWEQTGTFSLINKKCC